MEFSDRDIRIIKHVGVEMSWALPGCLTYLLTDRGGICGFSWRFRVICREFSWLYSL